MAEGEDRTLLEVRHLSVLIETREGMIRPVSDVSFAIGRREAVALVGESGSGKTLTGLSVLCLFPPGATVPSGEILFEGQDLLRLDAAALRMIRGQRISMIFQEPQSALNPVLTIGTQISELFKSHTDLSDSQVRERVTERLRSAGLPDPERVFKSYPHQLSGGMRQRVMIAMAIALDPHLVIADEPTTALDPTIALQILALLSSIRESRTKGLLFISHDLAHVRRVSDRVLVMYAGRIVEDTPAPRFFGNGPLHPYSRALLSSRPSGTGGTGRETPLPAIPGQVPPLWNLPPGCAFAPRCPRADDRCRTDQPPWQSEGASGALCFYPDLSSPGAPQHVA